MASINFVTAQTIVPVSWLQDVNDFVYDFVLPPTTLISIINGGTGAGSASGARTNLGLTIGTDVQAYSVVLDNFDNLAAGIVVKTTTSTFANRTITAGTGITVTNGNGIAGNPTITCTVDGTSFLTKANNLSDVASVPTSRTNLGLGTLATQNGTFSGTSSGTNTGDQIITLTGGVTGSGTGSFAATVVTNANLTGTVTSVGNTTSIANGAISNAMLANGAVANLSGTNTGDQNLFKTISVSGQSDVVADNTADTLTLVAGSNVTITTDATTDTITINSSGGGGGSIPGGSPGHMQYNNAGVFGGDSGLATDGAGALTLSGSINGTSIPSSKTLVVTTDIGSSVQAYSAQLTSAAGVADGIVAHTAANTFTPRTITGTANKITVSNGDGVAGNPTLNVGSDVYVAGGTDVAVLDGGTGSSTASGARTNLGVAIGSDVQAYSAQLASAASVSDGIVAHTAAGTFTPRTITGTANKITVSNGDGVSGNPTLNVGSDVYVSGGTDVAVLDGGTGASDAATARTNLGLAIGTNVQAYDANTAKLNVAQSWAAVQTFPSSDLQLTGSSTGSTTLNSGLSGASNNTLTLPITSSDTIAAVGTAQTWTAAQTYNDGTQILAGSSSGTTTLKATAAAGTTTQTFQAVSGTVLCTGGSKVAVTDGGTGLGTMTTAYAPVCAGTTATGNLQVASTGLSTSGFVLTSTGASSLPSFQALPTYGTVYLASATGTGVASYDFPTVFSSTYKTYIISINNLLPATDGVALWLRISTDSSTFKSGATDYLWAIQLTNGSASSGARGSVGDTKMVLTDTTALVGNNTGEGVSGMFYAFDPNAARKGYYGGLCSFLDSTATPVFNRVSQGGIQTTASAQTGFQLLFSSGNIASGTVKIYGMTAS